MQCISFPLASASKLLVAEEEVTSQKLKPLTARKVLKIERERQVLTQLQQTFALSDTSKLLSRSNLVHNFSGKRQKKGCEIARRISRKNILVNGRGKTYVENG